MNRLLNKTAIFLAISMQALVSFSNTAAADEQQEALKACPVAVEHLMAMKVDLDKMKTQNINTHSQEGKQQICKFMERELDYIDTYIHDLQDCKRNGIVGLQSFVQLSTAAKENTEAQYHAGCD